MNEMVTTGRSSAVIATEIRTIVRQTQQIILTNAMEIGKRLIEAKELVPHGEWGAYLEREVEFSQSTANNMMQLYREYGNDQQSLFGANSQAFADLPYTKALRLLAVPAEEREEFAAAVDVENISTRELEKAIRERDEAIKKEKEAQELSAAAQERFHAERDRVEKLTAERKQMDIEAGKANETLKQLKKELESAKKAEAEARKEAEAARAEGQKVPEAMLEQLRKDAEESAARAAREEAEARVQRAELAAKQASEKAEALQERLEQARKAKAAADPETAVFSVYFQELQESFNKCAGMVIKARGTDPDRAEKLVAAMDALIDRMKVNLHGGDGR